MDTAHLTDAEYALYEKLLRSGNSVNPSQFKTCKHCGNAYRVVTAAGASKNRCADEACKLAERAEQIKAENVQKKCRYRTKMQGEMWKHDPTRNSYKERKLLESVAGFCHV